jgi:hypothetical protein
MIFVFGSNESGIHGAGAAKFAMLNHGAVYGVGFGPRGNSFAIPTKDWQIGHLPLGYIKHYVERFIEYARLNPTKQFQVTALGTGLARHTPRQISKLFQLSPSNCLFDERWEQFLPNDFKYWGTF